MSADQTTTEERVIKTPKTQDITATHEFSEFSEDMPTEIADLIPELRASLTDATEIACAVLGNVDAGKSTLTASLCDRILDNGDGSARNRIAVHNHEIESGRTSDVASSVIKYSEDHINAFIEGRIHHELDSFKKNDKTAKKDKKAPMKYVGLHDLCGHEKYFGTTSHGVSSMYPDFAILAINPGRGVLDMTKEHYTIAVSLNIPVLVVVTKVDASVKNSCLETNKQIATLLKKYRRKPNFLNSYDDYHFYKTGETAFLRLREEFYEGDNVYGFEERAAKTRIKVQSMRDDRDAFLVELKAEMYSHVRPIGDVENDETINEPHPDPNAIAEFKDKYGLSDEEYDQLFAYINYNATKMSHINTIVSNLNTTASSADGQVAGKQSIVPVIYMSNFNSYSLDTIRDAIMFLKPRDIWDTENNSIIKMLGKKLGKPDLGKVNLTGSIFYIDRAYTVEGAGLVISGINRGDPIKINDKLWVGPINKNFVEIKIKSIHNDARQFVDSLDEHHRGCLNITNTGRDRLTKQSIKKGMVLISDQEMTKHVGYHFKAVITVLRNELKSTTLRVGACPLMDAGTIKQTARLKKIYGDAEDAGTNDVTETDMSFKPRAERKKTDEIVKPTQVKEVLLKFTRHPEFIPEGEQFIFRSGTVHGIGVVVQPIDIATDTDAAPDAVKKKHRRVRASNRSDQPVNTVTSVKVE